MWLILKSTDCYDFGSQLTDTSLWAYTLYCSHMWLIPLHTDYYDFISQLIDTFLWAYTLHCRSTCCWYLSPQTVMTLSHRQTTSDFKLLHTQVIDTLVHKLLWLRLTASIPQKVDILVHRLFWLCLTAKWYLSLLSYFYHSKSTWGWYFDPLTGMTFAYSKLIP